MSSVGGRGEAVSPLWGEKGKQKEHVYGNQLQFYLGFFLEWGHCLVSRR